MDFQTAVRGQLDLLNQGKPMEAFDSYFADDGVMFENDHPFASGKEACRAKQEPFLEGVSDIIGNITACTLDLEKSVCVFRNQSTFIDETGDETQMDGLHWQQWDDGQIIEERYYRGEPMERKLAEGILEEGVEFLDEDVDPLAGMSPHARAEAEALRTAILAALAQLVGSEQIELIEGATDKVADELMVASLEAHSPRHALKKLRLSLIHSENVEEVYASDLELEAAFRSAMGG